MESLLLKPRLEEESSIRIYDEIIEGMLNIDGQFCVEELGGRMLSLEYLVSSYKFPFKGDGEECAIVEYITNDTTLAALAEFYPYEEIEF